MTGNTAEAVWYHIMYHVYVFCHTYQTFSLTVLLVDIRGREEGEVRQ